jgi:hypothetical protein
MASGLYDKGRDAILNGDIDWTADTIKVALVTASYTPDLANDQFYSSASAAAVGSPMTLANKTSSAGVADADDVTSAALPSGSTIVAAVMFKDTGDASTSPLIAKIDLVSTPTNGGVVSLVWSNDGNKIFKL